jgi:hypothetical protein
LIPPKVYADFQNADASGRLRLNCIGTGQDLARQGISLHEGLALLLYSDDADIAGRPSELQVAGVVEFSAAEHGWVAVIDWDALRHMPSETAQEKNGRDDNGPLATEEGHPSESRR